MSIGIRLFRRIYPEFIEGFFARALSRLTSGLNNLYILLHSKQPTHPKYCGGDPTPPASVHHRQLLYHHFVVIECLQEDLL